MSKRRQTSLDEARTEAALSRDPVHDREERIMKEIPRTTTYTMGALMALAVAICAFLIAASPAFAATITVTTTNDENNADGDCSLREAIISANGDAAVDACTAGDGADTITLGANTYDVSIPEAGPNDTSNGDLDIFNDLTIDGAGARSTTVRGVAGFNDRIFENREFVTATISDLTITGGNGFGSTNDRALIQGGGVQNFFGTLTLDGVAVTGNRAVFAGGIRSSGTLTVTDSTVSGNRATTLSTLDGGILEGEGGTARIVNSTISGNQDAGGAAIAVTGDGSAMEVRSSTVARNDSIGVRTGLGTTFIAQNSVIAGNANGNCLGEGTFTSQGHNISDGPTCPLNQPTDQPDTDPLLGPLADNGGPTDTHALLAGSPAIDKGNTDLTEDQRGEPRPFDDPNIAPATGGDNSDIGSFEAQTVLNSAPEAKDDAYSTNEDTSLTVDAPGVLQNDTDAEDDSLTAELVDDVDHGTLTLDQDGSFAYEPDADFNGSDSFTYKANDGSLDSNTATVSIIVNAVNDAPTITVVAGSGTQSACLSATRGRTTLKLSDVDSNVSALTLSEPFKTLTRDG